MLRSDSEKNESSTKYSCSDHLNITLKDLNIETRKILRKTLLRDDVKKSRDENDIYLSGPHFPCRNFVVTRRSRNHSFISFNENSNGEELSHVEKEPGREIVENSSSEHGECAEHALAKTMKYHEGFVNQTRLPMVTVSDLTNQNQVRNASGEKQSMTSEKEDNLQQSNNERLEGEDVACLDQKKHPSSSSNTRRHSSHLESKETSKEKIENKKLVEKTTYVPISRRASSQLEAKSSRKPSPTFERRRQSHLSCVASIHSSNCSPTKNVKKSNDHFALDSILNPTLRESLKRILNPQGNTQNLEIKNNDNEQSESLLTRQARIIFEEEILLPNIKGRQKYNSLDSEEERKGISLNKDSLSKRCRRKSTRYVRFESELRSTKCSGVVLTESQPVRMLSVGSEYAVKCLIGQWLKRRSENTVQTGRERKNAQKREAYREVKLLKVGLSMRMLASIV